MSDQYDRMKSELIASILGESTVKDGSFLVESIVQGRMPSELLQQLLADLRAKRHLAQTAPERIAIDGAIADVLDGLDGVFAAGGPGGVGGVFAAGGAGGALPLTPVKKVGQTAPAQAIAERPMSQHSPFYGMGLKEACPKLLWLIGEKQGKIPQTAREIWDHLKAEGWTSNHNNPAHSVNDALRRRAKTHGDVMLVGAGKWGRTDWFTDDQLEEIKKSMGGMGGRDRGDHIERTKAGMATARRRGARLGAVSKLSDEQGNQLLELARAGETKEKIAKQFGISPASVTNYVKRFGYNSVRELKHEGKKLRAAAVGLTDNDTDVASDDGTRH